MPIPEFIQALRAKIGTDLLQVPTAAVMASDEQGRLLLVQDAKSGLWGLPSGIIDPHELPSDAAVRETWEEAGVVVALTRLLGVFAGEHFSAVYDNGDRLAVVSTVFAGTVIRGTPHGDGEETSDARFVSADEISRLPCARYFLTIYRAVDQHAPLAYFKTATWQPPAA